MPKIFEFIIKNIKNIKFIGEVEEKIITEAEKELQLSFPSQVREIIKEYGCISYKHWELYGLGVKEESHLNIVRNTLELRKYKLPKSYIPVMELYDGRYAVVDNKNSVYVYGLNNENLTKMDISVDNFLLKLFTGE